MAAVTAHPLLPPFPSYIFFCPFAEVTKKEVDIVTIPDGSEILVHEPRLKLDLTKYLDHHNFKCVLWIDVMHGMVTSCFCHQV